MRADFVNEVGKALDIKRTDLIEKDFILHQMLTSLRRQVLRWQFSVQGRDLPH